MQTGAEVQAHILLKVTDDAEFRLRLKSDPKGTIEAETGLALPDDQLVFVKEAIASAEAGVPSVDTPLSKDELIQVMGGECFMESLNPWDPPGTCGDEW